MERGRGDAGCATVPTGAPTGGRQGPGLQTDVLHRPRVCDGSGAVGSDHSQGRSGSASQAGAPEFIDHIVGLQTERQTAIRGGLVWLDTECRKRFDKAFLECADAERRQVLDDIAWPRKAKPELSHGVRFFSAMRDLVAAGYWSSKVGVQDLGYMGNVPTTWNGAPAEVLQKLGVSYE